MVSAKEKKKERKNLLFAYDDHLRRKSKRTDLKTPGTVKVIIAKMQTSRFIYKSQLFSYIPAKNNWNLKLKTQNHLQPLAQPLATTTKCCSKNLTNYKKKRKKMM